MPFQLHIGCLTSRVILQLSFEVGPNVPPSQVWGLRTFLINFFPHPHFCLEFQVSYLFCHVCWTFWNLFGFSLESQFVREELNKLGVVEHAISIGVHHLWPWSRLSSSIMIMVMILHLWIHWPPPRWVSSSRTPSRLGGVLQSQRVHCQWQSQCTIILDDGEEDGWVHSVEFLTVHGVGVKNLSLWKNNPNEHEKYTAVTMSFYTHGIILHSLTRCNFQCDTLFCRKAIWAIFRPQNVWVKKMTNIRYGKLLVVDRPTMKVAYLPSLSNTWKASLKSCSGST